MCGGCDCVCVCVCVFVRACVRVDEKRLELCTKFGTRPKHMLYGRTLACFDSICKRSRTGTVTTPMTCNEEYSQ